jgi:hypothetical protein
MAGMASSDLTIEHYSRPEVKAVILNYCMNGAGMRALNSDEHWYKGGSDPKTVMLRGPADYADTITKGRTLYSTLDFFDPAVFEQSETWIEERNTPEKPIGDLSSCLAFTLSTDIDAIGDIRNLAVKEAVEAAAQFFVDYLREKGIEKNVHGLYSGGGIYVHLHHALFAVKVGDTDLTPAEIKRQFQILTKAYNRLISDISQAFFRKHPEHIGKVKFDQLNNQKRTFKTIFSLHKRLPFAVIPLDPKQIKIDFARASLPLSDEVLAEGAAWYTTFDPSEKEAIVTLLKPKMDEVKQIIRDRPTEGNNTISRLPEPLDLAEFPPCMKSIIADAQAVEGRHRALGILATFLYQAGWSEDAAFDLWVSLADRCGVEPRIFETEFGRVSCPRCSTIQKDTGGYPNLNLYNLGFCKPDVHCKGCQWPGDYHTQKILNEHGPGRTESEVERPRAVIKLCGDLIRNEEEVLAAVYAYNSPPIIYQRGGSLCRIKQVSEDRYKIEDQSDYALRNEISRAATFQRFKPKKKNPEESDEEPEGKWQIIACEPPMSLVRGIMALDSWSVPRINGIISAPAVRPDGSLLLDPGYDEATGMFYRPDPALSVTIIPESPTKDDAIEAAKFFFDEALHDFPFVDDSGASKAGALAAFLTPIIRPMIKGGVPMALIDKPAPGTGASLLLDLISIVAMGSPMAALSVPGDEEEWRKLITSVMRDGAALAALDNIASDLKADALSRALTSTIWEDRTLGKPDAAEYAHRACWYANGNNLALSGDLPRRSHLIQLDAKVEKPWTRTKFRHANIKTWVTENRGALLASLLTMARAWVIAGRPNGCKAIIGGFDEWVQIVGGILDYAGVPGFLDNLPKLYEEVDVGSDEWADFLAAWKDTYKKVGKTSSEVLEDLRNPYTAIGKCTPSELAERIKYRSPGDAKKVGLALRKKLNVRYKNGLMLTLDIDSHSKQRFWKVVEQTTIT